MPKAALPRFIINSSAPIRICDNGGWTDTWFAEYGSVFNIAVAPLVEVQLLVYEQNAHQDNIIINAENYNDRYQYTSQRSVSEKIWGKHPLLEAAIEYMHIPPGCQFEAVIFSSAPGGASTGTSAAVCVALIGALDYLTPGRLTPGEIAAGAHKVETDLLGGQSGIQDQLSAAFGGINYIEMDHYPHSDVHPIHIPDDLWWELERRLCLIYLGRSHSSSDTHRMVIKSLDDAGPACKQLDDIRATALRSRDALLDGDLNELGKAMIENTGAQERLHPDIINRDTLRLIQIAKEHDAVGWKSNGAGGEGGSLTILCGPDASEKRRMIKSIESDSHLFRNIPVTISRCGVKVWEQT